MESIGSLDHVIGRGLAVEGRARVRRAADHRHTIELGVKGDTIDFRKQGLVLGVQERPFHVRQLTRTGLHREGLHPDENVRNLGHRAVGDLKHRGRLDGIDLSLFLRLDLGVQTRTDGHGRSVVLSGHDSGTRRQLGERRRKHTVANTQVPVGNVRRVVRDNV